MGRPNSKVLALRDPALAALMGAVGSMGSDFGGDFSFGEDDENFGFDFGADAATGSAMVAQPPPQVAAQLWAKHVQSQGTTQKRARLLEPNKGSAVKVERYAFYLNETLVLGTASAISATNNPDTNIRPQRVTMNAPSPGFVTVSDLKVANVSTIVGGTADAYEFNANGVGQTMDLPTLSPANRATLTGAYTGFTPPGFVGGSSYVFSCGLKGPASIVA
jgi:hypothetical protein